MGERTFGICAVGMNTTLVRAHSEDEARTIFASNHSNEVYFITEATAAWTMMGLELDRLKEFADVTAGNPWFTPPLRSMVTYDTSHVVEGSMADTGWWTQVIRFKNIRVDMQLQVGSDKVKFVFSADSSAPLENYKIAQLLQIVK